MCHECTVANGMFVDPESGTCKYREQRVEPLPAWTGHVHRWEYHGWDGSDNYYRCRVCKVRSHDHAGFEAHRLQKLV